MIKSKKIHRPPAFELLDQALALFGEQQFAAAIEVIGKGLKLAPRNGALWNLLAACALRLGDAARAEHAWRQALIAEPRNPLFHSNLAMLLAELSRLEEAEALCRRALAIDGRLAIVHFNFGVVLAKAGRAAEAEQTYKRALELEPRHEQAGYNLGVLLAQQRRYAEAEPAYRQALAVDPLRVDARVNLGVVLSNLQRIDEAEACFRGALDRQPDNREAMRNLGGVLMRQNRRDEADRYFSQSGNIRSAVAQVNLALLMKDRGRLGEAEAALNTALAIDADSLSAHISMGELLDEQGRSEEARGWFEKAMAIHPSSALGFGAMAHSLARGGDYEQAEHWFRQAIAKPRDAALSRMVFGAFLLTLGRYEEGFALYEGRYAPERSDPFQRPPDTDTPRWTGQDLSGRSILIWPEQGFGDQIQFCRYAALLKARGAVHVALVTHEPLIELFGSLQAVDEVMSFLQFKHRLKQRRDAYDYWSYVMSLPLHCGTGIDNIPAQLPYLKAPSERLDQWKDQLPPRGLRVGLVWKGSKNHKNDLNRSLPGLAALAPLWSVPGIQFISLQKGQGEDEAAAPPASQPLLDLGSQIRDFADTAAIVQQLDLVICVDTAIAHLAGALATPCWLLLPVNIDWRWQLQRSDSLWYPGALRLFRQSEIGNWSGPLDQVLAALGDWAATAAQRH
ncbi:MAG: tetratricopeptide repeat-containing protein [Hydrocarboniphaga sp.]|uniref:tetratricopeptide repeat protein n=1 Tax=Hydrocarboniphaga sp. TaxID=2033016 RepID=UPI00263532E8|nr:tetratricopeptide repeat protein [Hydrocarboniphaga sp.]MDB5970431.1 tetratricopeptide repeat-containing protein [Hydrocarboniphaga sp.]